MKTVPEFKNEEEESEFWQKNDSTEYVDWDNAEPAIFSKLKPSTKSVSIRLPVSLINKLKLIANKRDVPYQSFLKSSLQDIVHKELN